MKAQEQTWENHPYFTHVTKQQLHPDFKARIERGDFTQLDFMNNLSDIYGLTHRHPRTDQLIRHQTSDVLPRRLLRKGSVAYKPQTRSIGQKMVTREGKHYLPKDNKGLTVGSTDKRIRSSNRLRWKTVWYTKHQRRQ